MWDRQDLPMVDPICGMQVESAIAPCIGTFVGETYAFCSEECYVLFMRAPERYIALSGAQPRRTLRPYVPKPANVIGNRPRTGYRAGVRLSIRILMTVVGTQSLLGRNPAKVKKSVSWPATPREKSAVKNTKRSRRDLQAS
jgi:YHS domain-containing protein